MIRNRGRTFLKYVVPSVLASSSSFLYTIVDGIFVGHGVGKEGLGAVNLALPFTLISTSLGMLMTIGGVTMTAIHLGKGDEKAANRVFGHALTAAAVIGGLLTLLGMAFAGPIALFSGANDTFLEMTVDYIFFYSMFSLPFLLSITLQSFVRNDGEPGLVSLAAVAASATNIFLDWLFVFPLQMGVRGAAIATGLGQITGLVILLSHLAKKKGVLRIAPFVPSVLIWKEMIGRGIPAMVSQFGTPVMTLCMNRMVLVTLGDMALSAFSVMSYLMSLSQGLFSGVSDGCQPLFGQSFGAQKKEDLSFYFHMGMKVNGIMGVAVYILIALFGQYACALFNPDQMLAAVAGKALPKFGLKFLFSALNSIILAYLYSTKRTVRAVFLAVLRCIVLNSACILFLTSWFGGNVVWYTPGIAEAMSFAAASVFLWQAKREEYD